MAGARGQETALEDPPESGKHLDLLGREGRGTPQFFLVLGVSYFLLLEYHSSRGMPIEGSVMTPKAAQSSCGGRQRPRLQVWTRAWDSREGGGQQEGAVQPKRSAEPQQRGSSDCP